MPDNTYRDMRRVNQYALPRSPQYDDNSQFHTEIQERILKEVIMIHEKFYVEQKYIEMTKIEQNLEYFGEAKTIWEELGLVPLMTFVKDRKSVV